jgi:hypothetical protein
MKQEPQCHKEGAHYLTHPYFPDALHWSSAHPTNSTRTYEAEAWVVREGRDKMIFSLFLSLNYSGNTTFQPCVLYTTHLDFLTSKVTESHEMELYTLHVPSTCN